MTRNRRFAPAQAVLKASASIIGVARNVATIGAFDDDELLARGLMGNWHWIRHGNVTDV
nr:hypothetical protein [Brucella intermedia]